MILIHLLPERLRFSDYFEQTHNHWVRYSLLACFFDEDDDYFLSLTCMYVIHNNNHSVMAGMPARCMVSSRIAVNDSMSTKVF